MDETLRKLVDFVADTRYEDIPEDVLARARTIWIDSLACAAGGRDAPGAAIAGRLADDSGTEDQGYLFGANGRVRAETAAFGNTCMIRHMDLNDGLSGGHPSDMIGALMSVMPGRNVSIGDVLTSLVIAYEVYARISDFVYRDGFFPENRRVQPLSVDQGLYVCVGATAGMSRLLGLTREQTVNALSLAVSAGFPLRTSRAGELSDLKGTATAISSRNAVFFSYLASQGMTAPREPFEGRHGLVELLTGTAGETAIEPFGLKWLILNTGLKYFPTTSNCQVGVWAALHVRADTPIDNIEKIEISASSFLTHESGSEPSKWNPTTRETADHSLPYVFCKALRDGRLDFDEFDDGAAADAGLRDLMETVTVTADPNIDRTWPDVFAVRVRITDTDGRQAEHYEENPRGVPQNPMSESDIGEKFVSLAGGAMGEDGARELFERLWSASADSAVESLLSGFVFAEPSQTPSLA